jgi:perosamine synthetase
VIPLSEPFLHGDEWSHVKECLDTNWVSSAGAYVTRFEHEVARVAEAKYGVAVASGTAALHVALLVAGVRPGDEVLVPSLTFIAPANAVRYVGAAPVFVDVEPSYWQMDVEHVSAFLDRQCDQRDDQPYNRATGRRIGALLVVDVLGHPVDADAVRAVASRHRLPVVEDATESLGALYKNRPVGNLGDIGCFSFNGNKTITSGGGGMVVTDDEAAARRARYLTTQARDDEVEYVHHAVGFNYRLTNIQAALGVAQLDHLDEHVQAKRRIAARYAAAFSSVPGLQMMREAPWAVSSCWLSTLLVDPEVRGEGSRTVIARLRSQGIQARPLWQPLHLSPAHAGAQVVGGAVAETLHDRAVSLPSSVNLSDVDQQRVIDAVVG